MAPFVSIRITIFNGLGFHRLGCRGRVRCKFGVLLCPILAVLLCVNAVSHYWNVLDCLCVVRLVGKLGLGPIGVDEMRRRGGGLTTSRRGHFGLFVFVVRVARRASCLLDVIFDHRHYHMVGNTALARTVVIENVTEPKPALRHEIPRNRFRQAGV